MRVALGLAANDLLLPVVGAALLSLLGVTERLGVGVRLLGLSYLAGWALLGLVLSFALVLGLPFTVASIVLVAVALVAACAVAARARRLSLPAQPGPGSDSRLARWTTRIGAVLLAVGALVAFVTAVRSEWNPASDYDAFWFWLPRSETIFYSHHLDPGLWSQFAHAEYPPLMPVMTAMTFAFTGGFHPSLLPFQQALLGIAFLLAVLALLDRFVPRWLSVPTLALLGTAPWFWGKLESPMPDQTLAYLIALAALACVLWLCEPAPAWLALGLLFLAAAGLTKLEGTLSGAALAIAMIVAGLLRYRRAGLRACVLLLGPGAILLWRAWLSVHGLRGASPDYKLANLLDPGFLERRAARLHYSLHEMAVIADRIFGGTLAAAGARLARPARDRGPDRGLARAPRLRRSRGAGDCRRPRDLADARLRRHRGDLLDRAAADRPLRRRDRQTHRGDPGDGDDHLAAAPARPGVAARARGGPAGAESRDRRNEPAATPPARSGSAATERRPGLARPRRLVHPGRPGDCALARAAGCHAALDQGRLLSRS